MTALLLTSPREEKGFLRKRLLSGAQTHSPERKLPGFQVDLIDELSSGGHDDALGLLQLSEAAGGDAVMHHVRQDRQEKSCLQVKWHNLQITKHPFTSIVLV